MMGDTCVFPKCDCSSGADCPVNVGPGTRTHPSNDTPWLPPQAARNDDAHLRAEEWLVPALEVYPQWRRSLHPWQSGRALVAKYDWRGRPCYRGPAGWRQV